MSVKVITDSTSYIPEKLIKEYDIRVVSLNVIMENESHKEVEIGNDEFYKKMEAMDSIPTSSQPSVDEFHKVFSDIISNGDEAIGIFISSDMSGTYSTANHVIRDMIEEEFPNARMEVVDSMTNCMQLGYMVVEAAKLAKEGKTMDEILAAVYRIRERSRFLFVPDTLEYLKKGGRIGGAAALFGKILQIRPILTVENGKTAVFDKVRTKQKAVIKIIDKVKADMENGELGGLIVHHINCEEEGLALKAKVKEILGIDAEIQNIGPVIGCHVGPKAVGIAYYIK